MAFRPEMAFRQKLLSPENAFWPKIILTNLKWLFGQKWLFAKFDIKRLTSQSIERFGSPLMAESFQACFIKKFQLFF